MFRKARVKLTAWYLLIIMFISVTFSLVIFSGINGELNRIQNYQISRQQERNQLEPILEEITQERTALGLPTPPIPRNFNLPDPALISQARNRLILILVLINAMILVLAGFLGYVLAGITLAPIAQMIVEQKDFVSNASHELRTPLTSIRSEIEVFLRDKKADFFDAKALLKSNLEEVAKMQKLSNYLLSLNRYQSGVANLNFTKLDFKNIAEAAVNNVEKLAQDKKITIEKRLKSAKLNGNEDSLEELAVILLDNAIKYSTAGKKIIIKTKKLGLEGVLEVQDFGVGIKKNDLGNIFEKFYKAEGSRNKEKVDGYGLGLSIAKSIVDLHGGQINVKSELGHGTTFKVVI